MAYGCAAPNARKRRSHGYPSFPPCPWAAHADQPLAPPATPARRALVPVLRVLRVANDGNLETAAPAPLLVSGDLRYGPALRDSLPPVPGEHGYHALQRFPSWRRSGEPVAQLSCGVLRSAVTRCRLLVDAAANRAAPSAPAGASPANAAGAHDRRSTFHPRVVRHGSSQHTYPARPKTEHEALHKPVNRRQPPVDKTREHARNLPSIRSCHKTGPRHDTVLPRRQARLRDSGRRPAQSSPIAAIASSTPRCSRARSTASSQRSMPARSPASVYPSSHAFRCSG